MGAAESEIGHRPLQARSVLVESVDEVLDGLGQMRERRGRRILGSEIAVGVRDAGEGLLDDVVVLDTGLVLGELDEFRILLGGRVGQGRIDPVDRIHVSGEEADGGVGVGLGIFMGCCDNATCVARFDIRCVQEGLADVVGAAMVAFDAIEDGLILRLPDDASAEEPVGIALEGGRIRHRLLIIDIL